jgi:large subunit ribosomal protein L23
MIFFKKIFFKKSKKSENKELTAPKAEAKKEQPPVATQRKTTVKKFLGKTAGVLIKPLVSEKASFIGQYGQYIFEVSPQANKNEIARAVANTYGVVPLGINIIRVRGKEVRYGRTSGKTKSYKKAIVTLKPGDKIEVYEGV